VENSDPLELTRRLDREPNIETALLIIQWELGDLAKSHIYSQWHPDLASSYRVEARKALSDLFFQAHVVAALLEASPAKLLADGIETVETLIKEKEKKIGRFQHYNPPKEDKKDE